MPTVGREQINISTQILTCHPRDRKHQLEIQKLQTRAKGASKALSPIETSRAAVSIIDFARPPTIVRPRSRKLHAEPHDSLNIATLRRGACRLCHAPLTTTFVDLGMSPLCESFLTADQIDQMEPYLSAARARLRRMLSGAAAGIRQTGAYLYRIRVFFVVFDVLGRACAPVLRNDQGPAWSWFEEPSVRDRKQRRISASAFPAVGRSRDSASSRPPMWPKPRAKRIFPRWSSSSA